MLILAGYIAIPSPAKCGFDNDHLASVYVSASEVEVSGLKYPPTTPHRWCPQCEMPFVVPPEGGAS